MGPKRNPYNDFGPKRLGAPAEPLGDPYNGFGPRGLIFATPTTFSASGGAVWRPLQRFQAPGPRKGTRPFLFRKTRALFEPLTGTDQSKGGPRGAELQAEGKEKDPF